MSKEHEILGAPILYREWGYRFTVTENYDTAIKAFEKAQSLATKDDFRTDLGLSIALSKITRYAQAAESMDKCMQLAPHKLLVKWWRVETLFAIDEFGHSLIHAHQGMRQHRFPFEWGVFQGNETVEDCIGRNTSPVVLRELFPWIKKVEERRMVLIEKLNEEEEDSLEVVDDEQSKFKVNDSEVKLEALLKKLHRIMAERYLGLLARDKHFIETIMESEGLWSANVQGSHEIHALASSSHAKSCYRQDVLRIRQPFYTLIFVRRARSPGHKALLVYERQLRRNNIVIEANLLMSRLHEARIRRDYPLFFSNVERAVLKFESYHEKMFPQKRRCLDAIYKMVAWVYVDPRDLTCLEDEDTRTRYLKHHLGVRVGALPRDSELAWVPTLNKKATLRSFRRRLALASETSELSWIFHDLSKVLIEARRYDLARFYAKKSRDVSNKVGNELWALNANHILIRIEINQHNRNEAKETAQLALFGAKKLGIDYLIDFYKRVIKLVDDMDFDKLLGTDGIAAREQLILELMPDELRSEVDFLFTNMNVVPARRRLSVMPGCKPIDGQSSKRNTILPSPPRDPAKEARASLLRQYAPSKKIPGWVNFEEYE